MVELCAELVENELAFLQLCGHSGVRFPCRLDLTDKPKDFGSEMQETKGPDA